MLLLISSNITLLLLLLQLFAPNPVAKDALVLKPRKARLTKKALTKNPAAAGFPTGEHLPASTDHPPAATAARDLVPTPPPHLPMISIDDDLDVMNEASEHQAFNKSYKDDSDNVENKAPSSILVEENSSNSVGFIQAASVTKVSPVLNHRKEEQALGRILTSHQFEQIGSFIKSGTYTNDWGSLDWFGNNEHKMIDLSDNGLIMAVAASHGYIGYYWWWRPGYVKVYQRNDDDSWSQKGSTLWGPSSYSHFGWAVDLSANGLTLVVSAFNHDSNGLTNNGGVRVFDFTNGDWVSRGDFIALGTQNNEQSGQSISLSDDASTLAVSTIRYNTYTGRVRVFKYSGGSWNLFGNELQGGGMNHYFGHEVSFSSDATTLAVSAPGTNLSAGYVRIYKYDTNTDVWNQTSEHSGPSGVRFGYTISLSGNGQLIAVGSYFTNQVGRLYIINEAGSWSQIGHDIDNAQVVSLSRDGALLFTSNRKALSDIGVAALYMINTTARSLEQLGSTINGQVSGDQLGGTSMISSDGSTIAIGGMKSGVAVYKTGVLNPSSMPSDSPSSVPSVFPTSSPSIFPTSNPTKNPSFIPSFIPSTKPTSLPSFTPSLRPSSSPSILPSSVPTVTVTLKPSVNPTYVPSSDPSYIPTRNPSSKPSQEPTKRPSSRPSFKPTVKPSLKPSKKPSVRPTNRPSFRPSRKPSSRPSMKPTPDPSPKPSVKPSDRPSLKPTSKPSSKPSSKPQKISIISKFIPTPTPTDYPSNVPSFSLNGFEPVITSRRPTKLPTTFVKTKSPVTPVPTRSPSKKPSFHPSAHPTHPPSTQPSFKPTNNPSISPTAHPSASPTKIDFITIAQEFTGMVEGCKFPDDFHVEFVNTIKSQISVISGEIESNINAEIVWSDTVGTNCDPSAAPSGSPSRSPSTVPSSSPSVAPYAVMTRGGEGGIAQTYRLRRAQETSLSSLFIVYKVSMKSIRDDIHLDNIVAKMLEDDKNYLDQIIQNVPFFKELNDRFELKVSTLPEVPSSVPSFLPTEEGQSQNPSANQKPTEAGETTIVAAVSAAGAGASAAASSSAASSASSSYASASSASTAAGGAGATGGTGGASGGGGGGGGGNGATQNSNTSSGSGGTSSNSNNGTNTGPSTAEDSSSGGKANPKIQDVAPDAPETDEDDRKPIGRKKALVQQNRDNTIGEGLEIVAAVECDDPDMAFMDRKTNKTVSELIAPSATRVMNRKLVDDFRHISASEVARSVAEIVAPETVRVIRRGAASLSEMEDKKSSRDSYSPQSSSQHTENYSVVG